MQNISIKLRQIDFPLKVDYQQSLGNVLPKLIVELNFHEIKAFAEVSAWHMEGYSQQNVAQAKATLSSPSWIYEGLKVLFKSHSPLALDSFLHKRDSLYPSHSAFSMLAWDLALSLGWTQPEELGLSIPASQDGLRINVTDFLPKIAVSEIYKYPRVKVRSIDEVKKALKSFTNYSLLILDANRSIPKDYLYELNQLLEDRPRVLLEEPFLTHNSDELIDLINKSNFRYGIDESWALFSEVIDRILIKENVVVALKLSHLGTLKAMRDSITRLSASKVPTRIAGMFDTGLARSVLLKFATTIKDGDLPHDLGSPQQYLANDILRYPCTVKNGIVLLKLHRKGLVEELDFDAINRLTYEHRTMEFSI